MPNRKGVLNKKGIRQLADDLVAHKKRYDQDTYGDVSEDCGTVCCLAGFCYLRKVGMRKFNQLVQEMNLDGGDCINAGQEQLGISGEAVFDGIESWPRDLSEEYWENGPKGRVIVALKALQRLKPTGAIDRKISAVHTRIPQLRALLAEQAKEQKKAQAA